MTKNERIASLEARVARLEMRLLVLEAQRIGPVPPVFPYPAPGPYFLPPWTSPTVQPFLKYDVTC